MGSEKWSRLVLVFKKQVCDRDDDIDPNDDQDWYSLSIGWALAKGLEPQDAYQFAEWMRYEKNYFKTE